MTSESVVQEGFLEPFTVPTKACKRLDNGVHEKVPV